MSTAVLSLEGAPVSDENPIPVITSAHEKIHHSEGFVASHLFSAVANDCVAYLRIVPAAKQAHVEIDVAAMGKAVVDLFRDTTYTAQGTDAIKANRVIGGAASATVVKHTPTVNVLGTQLLTQLVPGTTGGNKISGSASTRQEFIVPVGKELLVRVTNKSGGAIDICVLLEWYEV